MKTQEDCGTCPWPIIGVDKRLFCPEQGIRISAKDMYDGKICDRHPKHPDYVQWPGENN